MRLRYEELVARPDEHAESILGFLGIRHPESRSRFRTKMCEAHRRSAYTWRHELSSSQLEQIEVEAGSLLRQLGYADSTE